VVLAAVLSLFFFLLWLLDLFAFEGDADCFLLWSDLHAIGGLRWILVGRGTEEVKTNDVTDRVGIGQVGFTIELGRPGIGARFRDFQEMSRALAKAGVSFEKNNPITTLMTDVTTGDIRTDILNEKVMSAIIEIKVPVERTEEIIRIIWEVEKRINTQVVIGVGVRCDADGEERIVLPILEKLGYNPQRAKTNIGLGRKVIRDLTNAAPVAASKEMVNA